jgi:hypothetical protein
MKLLYRVFCLILITVLVFQTSPCLANNLGYNDSSGASRVRPVQYDLASGKLAAEPWEYRLAFLIAGYDYKNIVDMNYYIATGKWVQLEKDLDVKVLDFGDKRELRITDVHLKKGDWVLKNGSNYLMLPNGNVIQRRVWEWWRTDTFREIVALVAYVAIVAAVGSLLANSIGSTEAHNYIYNISSGGGPSQLPPSGPSGGGPAPLPSN